MIEREKKSVHACVKINFSYIYIYIRILKNINIYTLFQKKFYDCCRLFFMNGSRVGNKITKAHM